MKIKFITIFVVAIVLLTTTACVSFPPGTSLFTHGGVSYYGGRPVIMPGMYNQPFYGQQQYYQNFGIGHSHGHHGGGHHQGHGHHNGGHHR